MDDNGQLANQLHQLMQRLPQLQAALGPVMLLEQQAGEHQDPAASLLAAYEAAEGIARRQPEATTPFEQELDAAGLDRRQRNQAGKLLLGAELRRGLYTYRLAGLAPGASEDQLVQALKQQLNPETREGLEALHGWLEAQGRPLAESDLYLAAWSEGLRFASADPHLSAEVSRQPASGFVGVILDWGRRLGERTRVSHGSRSRPSLH